MWHGAAGAPSAASLVDLASGATRFLCTTLCLSLEEEWVERVVIQHETKKMHARTSVSCTVGHAHLRIRAPRRLLRITRRASRATDTSGKVVTILEKAGGTSHPPDLSVAPDLSDPACIPVARFVRRAGRQSTTPRSTRQNAVRLLDSVPSTGVRCVTDR